MKRELIYIIVAVAMMLMGSPLYLQASLQNKPQIVPGQVVIKYKRGTLAKTTAASVEALGITVTKSFDEFPFVVGKFSPEKNIEEVLNACRALPNVEFAEPNYYVHTMETRQEDIHASQESISARQSAAIIPNDPRFNEQWYLNQESGHDIDAPEAWNITIGSSDVIVGIIDTGIEYDHEDLKSNIWINPGETGDGKENNHIDDDLNGYIDDWRGWDFANRDNDPYDDNGSGTHSAGIIGAVGNNGKGVAGVNWNVKLMALKFLGGNGGGSNADAAEAIIYATNNGAKILSNSWGGGGFSQLLKDAIQYAHDRGVLFIAAAGLAGSDNDLTPNYPAGYEVPNVVSVTSSDRDDKLFGNFGRRTVDLAAPGLDILSTYPLGRYQSLATGATAQVAGVCALVWARYPDAKPHQVLVRVLGGVDRKAEYINLMTTEGRLNAANALSTHPIIAYTTAMDNTTDTVGPYVIQTNVVDDGMVSSVFLVYTVNGKQADTLKMAPAKNDTYMADISGQPFNSNTTYKVMATDDDGNRTASPTFGFAVGTMPAPLFNFRSFPRVTNDSTPSFEWQNIPEATAYHVSLSFNPEFFPSFIDSTISPFYEVPSPLPDGAWYIRIRSVIQSGMASLWSTGELFTVDTAAPINATIQVNDDSAYTRFRAVTLQFDAFGVRPGVDSVRFANGNEREEIPWSLFEKRTRPWHLAEGEDGLRQVYVQFKDRAGNFSEPDSDSIVLDSQGPLFPSASPRLSVATPAINQALDVTLDPPNDNGTGLKRFDLFYRRAGENWQRTPFQNNAARIPAEFVTNRGVDYRIVAEDSVGNRSNLPDSTPNFFSIPVSIPPGEAGSSPGFPGGTTASAYRLVSLPLIVENQAVSEVFTNLGAYGAKNDYRFWRLEANKQWHEGEQLHVQPGESYFLIKRGSATLSNKSAGTTAKSTDGASGSFDGWQLRSNDWTLVGNPFNFEIDLARLWLKTRNIRLDTMRNVWSYDGTWKLHPQRLEPWGGIVVFNSGDADMLIYEPPDDNPSASPTAKSVERHHGYSILTQNLGPNEWLLPVRAESRACRDEDNYFGVRKSAKTGPDEFDYHEPPLLPGGLSLSFIAGDEARRRNLAVDIRPLQTQGNEWTVLIQSQSENDVTLSFEDLEKLPPELEIYLFDPGSTLWRDLRQQSEIAIYVPAFPQSKTLTVLVGEKSFLQEHTKGLSMVPASFIVYQNFPNPFNPATMIQYGLPRAERVTLKIYNLLGKEVATLVDNEPKAPGYHAVIWNGRNKNGMRVASGVYVYRMRAGSIVMAKKLALVK
jgi:hypothetical protein